MSEIQNAQKEAEVMSADDGNHQSDGSEEDAPIWPPRPKKRRKTAYLNFSKVAETFPDTSTDVVCQLAEMGVIKPSNVVKLVPQATKKQIASFLQIAQESCDYKEVAAVHKESIPKPEGGVSQLGWLKKAALESIKQAGELDSPTVEDSQWMKELRKLVPQEDGGTESTSVKF